MRGVAPVLQALAKLNEVKVFDDEAAWAAAAQAAPVAWWAKPACACSWKLTWPPRRPACPRKSRASKAKSPRPTPSWATKPSWPKPAAVIDQEKKRVADFTATLP
jgi:valyl-tRNA synthetase